MLGFKQSGLCTGVAGDTYHLKLTVGRAGGRIADQRWYHSLGFLTTAERVARSLLAGIICMSGVRRMTVYVTG